MQSPMFRLDGKNALVTGAATGLGQAISVALARQGASVAISDKPGISVNDTASRAGEHAPVFTFEMDVRDTQQRAAGLAAVQTALGRVDILINNAGINRPAPGLTVTEAEWDDHFGTNVKGGFFLAQAVAPEMIENNGGRIIWISSQSGLVAIPGQPVYCSSKGAVIQLVRTLGVEWAQYGITVNSVAPTFVETNMTRARLQNPSFRQFVLGKIPSGRLAMADDVSAAVAFLASNEAGMVNCDVLRVDGGWTAW
jgi:NAD(P)-dependent dehydrogenase (short-subunit alcohol dehydrogenase family)